MHPIERLRMVARTAGDDPVVVAREAAAVLADCAADLPALVTCCRRLVDHQPGAGPVWWLAARVLVAADPAEEAWRSAELLGADPTSGVLAHHLPEDSRVLVVGWPEQAGEALRRRGDCRVLVVDDLDAGGGLAAALRRAGSDAIVVDHAGSGAAAAASDLVVVEATAAGPGGFVAAPGSRGVAAVARASGIPVWLVAGRGRVLPEPLWQAVAARFAGDTRPWDRADEVVPLSLVSRVVGPDGAVDPAPGVGRPDCPVATELTRVSAVPGSRSAAGADARER